MSIVDPTSGVSTPPADCQDCSTAERKGYCARARCYCGHLTCHAFESWVDLDAIAQPSAAPKTIPSRASSWDTREESTWIDQL